jgi:hypothetical protein
VCKGNIKNEVKKRIENNTKPSCIAILFEFLSVIIMSFI